MYICCISRETGDDNNELFNKIFLSELKQINWSFNKATKINANPCHSLHNCSPA